MKTFFSLFASLALGQCNAAGNHKSAAIKESVVAQEPEADNGELKIVKPKTVFLYPGRHTNAGGSVFVEDLAELADERKMYFQQRELQRKLSQNQRRRAKKASYSMANVVPVPAASSTKVICAPSSTGIKASKKSSKKSYYAPAQGCVPVAAPVVQPVYIAPLAPVAQPVAAPVTVPFYVPVAQPNSTPVGAPVAVTISLNTNTVPVATPSVSTPVATPISTPGTSAPAMVRSSSSAPVPTPIGVSTPVATPVSTPRTSAPAVVQSSSSAPISSPIGGTTAPVVTPGGSAAPVVPIYVQATAADCRAIVTGTGLVQGQNGMGSKTFTFTFTLGTVKATNIASVVATARAALRALVAQKVVKCGSRGKGSKRWRDRRKLQNESRGRGLQWHRHLLEENIVGNVNWDLKCREIAPCFMPRTCFSCTVTGEVFLKGPAPQKDVVEKFRGLIESPTFLKDSGLGGLANKFQPDFSKTIIARTSVGNQAGNKARGNEPGNEGGGKPVGAPSSNAGSRGDPHCKSRD